MNPQVTACQVDSVLSADGRRPARHHQYTAMGNFQREN